MVLYDDYILKDERKKNEFWDIDFWENIDSQDSEDLFVFLKKIILADSENIFSRLQALKNMISLTHINKIKERKTIAVLLDEMEHLELELLVCYRLKYLTLFYEKEKNEIKLLFTKYSEGKNDLVKAEAKYQLALTMFYDSSILTNKDEYLDTIYQAHQIFESVYKYEDNRFDAKLLDAICIYIRYCFALNIEKAELYHKKISDLLRDVMLLQLDEASNSIYFNIGNNISSIHRIIKSNPENWLDYRAGFNKLCADFYELFNLTYKGRDFFNVMVLGVNTKLKHDVIEPIFKYNYKATITKINAILSEGPEEKTRHFLEYLKDILEAKEIEAVNISKQNLKANFPMLTLEDINSFKSSLAQANVSEAIYKIAKAINKFSPKELLNSIIRSCIRMQANHHYKKCKEDIRNDYIRDLLRTEGYDVLDQTRHGSSETGEGAGEVDLLFYDNEVTFAVFEALNLDSLKEKYLNTHIDKIYTYDTLGHKMNFLVSYVSVANFIGFWEKYKIHISNYEYPFKLTKVNEEINEDYKHSNLKVIATEHMRNGEPTILYHICVLM